VLVGGSGRSGSITSSRIDSDDLGVENDLDVGDDLALVEGHGEGASREGGDGEGGTHVGKERGRMNV
jgi:hypothetical protein